MAENLDTTDQTVSCDVRDQGVPSGAFMIFACTFQWDVRKVFFEQHECDLQSGIIDVSNR